MKNRLILCVIVSLCCTISASIPPLSSSSHLTEFELSLEDSLFISDPLTVPYDDCPDGQTTSWRDIFSEHDAGATHFFIHLIKDKGGIKIGLGSKPQEHSDKKDFEGYRILNPLHTQQNTPHAPRPAHPYQQLAAQVRPPRNARPPVVRPHSYNNPNHSTFRNEQSYGHPIPPSYGASNAMPQPYQYPALPHPQTVYPSMNTTQTSQQNYYATAPSAPLHVAFNPTLQPDSYPESLHRQPIYPAINTIPPVQQPTYYTMPAAPQILSTPHFIASPQAQSPAFNQPTYSFSTSPSQQNYYPTPPSYGAVNPLPQPGQYSYPPTETVTPNPTYLRSQGYPVDISHQQHPTQLPTSYSFAGQENYEGTTELSGTETGMIGLRKLRAAVQMELNKIRMQEPSTSTNEQIKVINKELERIDGHIIQRSQSFLPNNTSQNSLPPVTVATLSEVFTPPIESLTPTSAPEVTSSSLTIASPKAALTSALKQIEPNKDQPQGKKVTFDSNIPADPEAKQSSSSKLQGPQPTQKQPKNYPAVIDEQQGSLLADPGTKKSSPSKITILQRPQSTQNRPEIIYSDPAIMNAQRGKATDVLPSAERLKKALNIGQQPQEDQERKAKEEQEAKRKANEELERKTKAEQERKAKEELERKAQEEQEAKRKEELERKTKAEQERKANEELERKAQEEQEAKRKAKEEKQERKAKDLEQKKKVAEEQRKAEEKQRAAEEEERQSKAREKKERAKQEQERQLESRPKKQADLIEKYKEYAQKGLLRSITESKLISSEELHRYRMTAAVNLLNSLPFESTAETFARDHNKQNIYDSIQYLKEIMNNLEAPVEERVTAYEILTKFPNHLELAKTCNLLRTQFEKVGYIKKDDLKKGNPPSAVNEQYTPLVKKQELETKASNKVPSTTFPPVTKIPAEKRVDLESIRAQLISNIGQNNIPQETLRTLCTTFYEIVAKSQTNPKECYTSDIFLCFEAAIKADLPEISNKLQNDVRTLLLNTRKNKPQENLGSLCRLFYDMIILNKTIPQKLLFEDIDLCFETATKAHLSEIQIRLAYDVLQLFQKGAHKNGDIDNISAADPIIKVIVRQFEAIERQSPAIKNKYIEYFYVKHVAYKALHKAPEEIIRTITEALRYFPKDDGFLKILKKTVSENGSMFTALHKEVQKAANLGAEVAYSIDVNPIKQLYSSWEKGQSGDPTIPSQYFIARYYNLWKQAFSQDIITDPLSVDEQEDFLKLLEEIELENFKAITRVDALSAQQMDSLKADSSKNFSPEKIACLKYFRVRQELLLRENGLKHTAEREKLISDGLECFPQDKPLSLLGEFHLPKDSDKTAQEKYHQYIREGKSNPALLVEAKNLLKKGNALSFFHKNLQEKIEQEPSSSM